MDIYSMHLQAVEAVGLGSHTVPQGLRALVAPRMETAPVANEARSPSSAAAPSGPSHIQKEDHECSEFQTG